jgi:small subunit ribosomal protein S16
MALKIRLRRMGRKKAPTYRIVVAESSMPRDGRFVAIVGHYNPRTEPVTLVVDKPAVRNWLAKGALPTETVGRLLKKIDLANDEPTVVEAVVEKVKSTAKKAASGAKTVAAAAAAVAENVVDTVVDAAQAAVEEVREAVTGEEEKPAAAPVAEAPAEALSAADEAAAEVEADTTTAE